MSERLTPEALAEIRQHAAPRSITVRLLLAELDALTRERDALRDTIKEWTPTVLMSAAKNALEDAVKPQKQQAWTTTLCEHRSFAQVADVDGPDWTVCADCGARWR